MKTLAHLAFRVPEKQIHDFQIDCEIKLKPILQKYNLVGSMEPIFPPIKGVFRKLFEMESPSDVADKRRMLQQDTKFRDILGELSQVYKIMPWQDMAFFEFSLYSAPGGEGKTVDIGAGFRQGLWQNLSVQDGLPSSTIQSIYRDVQDNLWFATQNGIGRYDGRSLTTFSSEDGLGFDNVRAMLEDQSGNLWFGSGNLWKPGNGFGVSRFDGDRFRVFTTADGLGGCWISSICQDMEGAIWIGTIDGGVSRFDGNRFDNFTKADGLPSNNVRALAVGQDGGLWIGTNKGLVYRDRRPSPDFVRVEGLGCNDVRCILADQEENLWIGGEGGLNRYDGKHFELFTSREGLASDSVWALLQDREGCLWCGTWVGGLSRYDGKQFINFTVDDCLANNQVTSIAEDGEGYLWFGTHGGGVSRYDGSQWMHLSHKEGLAHSGVMAILKDRKDRLWIGTFDGLSCYDGSTSRNFGPQDGLISNQVNAIIEDRKGDLWLGTNWGLCKYDGNDFKNLSNKEGLVGWISNLVEDGQGRIWIATRQGVCRYDGNELVQYTTTEGLADNEVLSILEDDGGHLWFGTNGGGISRFDGEQFSTFTTADGLADNTVLCIAQDRQNNLWFGTQSRGVSRFDGEQFSTFTTADGLADNFVLTILPEQNGCIWFGTFGGGLSYFDGSVFQSLSRQDGLIHNTVQQLIQDRGDTIWIATEGGVARYSPGNIKPSLDRVEVLADKRYPMARNIEIPGPNSLLTFEFSGRSSNTPPTKLCYSYRLQGSDSDWKTTRRERVEYRNIELGSYVFEVRVVDRDLKCSETVRIGLDLVPDSRIKAWAQVVGDSQTAGEFVGDSEALIQVLEQLKEVAPTDLSVLILGETGTGKGLAALMLHNLSGRREEPFIRVNCGAIPEQLAESELFGHEKGAFTGALQKRLGKVELADGGTLFLDEIGDLTLATQVKLLHFLQEHSFERVGGTQTLQVNARIVAATNRDLKKMVEEGTFRQDLFYRLQSFPVELPPLRRRRRDILLLAYYFAERFSLHLNRPVPEFSHMALDRLQNYDWPGNVRELEHLVQRAALLCKNTLIEETDLGLGESPPASPGNTFSTLVEMEKQHIKSALERSKGVVSGPKGAARLLDMHPETLRSRMKKHGFIRGEWRTASHDIS